MIGTQTERRAAIGAAEWLSLAAAPTFAAMAAASGIIGGNPPPMICAMSHDGMAMGGMVPMYVLMSVFHAVPWLRLIARQLAWMRSI